MRGHLNLTFIYHLSGVDEVVHEHMQVSERGQKQTEAPDRLNSTFLPLAQIDGMADFSFDLQGYHQQTKSHLAVAFYNGHVDEGSVTVLVHVTDQLTGNAKAKGPSDAEEPPRSPRR